MSPRPKTSGWFVFVSSSSPVIGSDVHFNTFGARLVHIRSPALADTSKCTSQEERSLGVFQSKKLLIVYQLLRWATEKGIGDLLGGPRRGKGDTRSTGRFRWKGCDRTFAGEGVGFRGHPGLTDVVCETAKDEGSPESGRCEWCGVFLRREGWVW